MEFLKQYQYVIKYKKGKTNVVLFQGYLFIEGKLSISQGLHRKLLVIETHEGGLMGHFWGREYLKHIIR